MLKKINHILNIIMGGLIGVYIGYAGFQCLYYLYNPKIYAMYSAPWYTGIMVYGILTAIILAVLFTIKVILKIWEKHKYKENRR